MTWILRLFGLGSVVDRLTNLEMRMATVDEAYEAVNAKMAAINGALTGIAGDIQALKDQIVGGLTPDQAAKLDLIIARVNETAASAQALDAQNP